MFTTAILRIEEAIRAPPKLAIAWIVAPLRCAIADRIFGHIDRRGLIGQINAEEIGSGRASREGVVGWTVAGGHIVLGNQPCAREPRKFLLGRQALDRCGWC